MKTAKDLAQELLQAADIQINGSRPWDLQVYDERLYCRALKEGSLGLGEAYMDGWWDAPALDEFFTRLLAADIYEQVSGNWKTKLWQLSQIVCNWQSPSRAAQVGEHHYDLGNDLFEAMLDRRLTYTCGYWPNATNLDEAQEAKLDLVCRKLKLQPGQVVLDIGCGWGSFAKFAAERYQARVVGITVSKEQVELGNKLCAGLPVEIRFQDYRDISGRYDHIVSLGMFEHVGFKNYRTYFRVAAKHLKPEGLFLLQTIGVNTSGRVNDPWFGKYIFPNYALPSPAQITKAIEHLFVLEDWHNFGNDYNKTLMAWYANFEANWERLRPRYGDRFYRMWKYYLLACAGSFRARRNQVWQIVLSPRGVPGGYTPVR
ncbi:MAG: cyclopropane fatty acyl phospholipid synthase [Desulfobacca sp.]|uniref:cyclopropane fatty acyl phospholipid synthase n=1 Tax=Desulfobacca sp. TaxID=2067990 RepID=UPI004049D02C